MASSSTVEYSSMARLLSARPSLAPKERHIQLNNDLQHTNENAPIKSGDSAKICVYLHEETTNKDLAQNDVIDGDEKYVQGSGFDVAPSIQKLLCLHSKLL